MLAEGAGTTAQCFMVAHRRDRPREMHAILLEPCGSTVLGDLIANVNCPWGIRFARETKIASSQTFLAFRSGIRLMLGFYQRCKAAGAVDITISKLIFTARELDQIGAARNFERSKEFKRTGVR